MSAAARLLFTPLKVGNITVQNRIVFSAHLTNFAEDFMPTDRHACYYRERARGGVGLIITEEHSVHPTDHPYEKLIHAFNPAVLPGYRRITEMVHAEGTPILAQINHNGGQSSGMFTRLPAWAPSAIADPLFREVPKAVEHEDIHQIIDGYATVAGYTKRGGFDGVELQCSHSSIVRQFLSRSTNTRTDEYGGSLENRARLLREIIGAIRLAVGRDYVLSVRLCGDELIRDGITIDETVDLARLLERDRLIDCINTSIGTATQTLYMIEASMRIPPNYAMFIPSAIRKAVHLPVIGVGRVKDPIQAERLLAEGHADLVGVVRAQIADPEFARKARENRADDIRLCLSCNQECVGRMGLNRWLGCIETPATGREQALGIGTLQPAKPAKRVTVVGGGPAGLKAAAVRPPRPQGDAAGKGRAAGRAGRVGDARHQPRRVRRHRPQYRARDRAAAGGGAHRRCSHARVVAGGAAGRGDRCHRLAARPPRHSGRRRRPRRRCHRHPCRSGDAGQAGAADRSPRFPRGDQHRRVHGRTRLRGGSGNADALRRPGPGRHPRSGELVPAGPPARHPLHA
ncbi:MAG: hypothetical protein U1E38_03030 [Rhodospirillales bacterium]